MNNNNGYIYIRQHIYYDNDNICKLGKTNNLNNRNNCYITGEYKRGYFKLVIEILNNQKYDNTFIERLLQNNFKNYHRKIDGGNEFYNKDIINKIVPFLSETRLKFRVLTKEEIYDIINQEKINNMTNQEKDLKLKVLNMLHKNKKINKNSFRDNLQNIYVNEIINQLNLNKKAFLKAPTGFGKTHIYYKIISEMKFNKILFLTPRILLNQQIVEDKYSFYIHKDNYKFMNFSILDNLDKEKILKKVFEENNKIIMTCCYQSGDRLLKYIKNFNFIFDIIIYDEAHFITSWCDLRNKSDFLINNNICNYRLYGSATPTEEIENNPLKFGKVIEKVKVYELINKKLLCDIVTIVKQLNEKKSEYHNLKNLIVESMINYNKKKGIIYLNNCNNAENLYKLLNDQNKINVYIYISKNIKVKDENDTNIKSFEDDREKCVIICVGKIGYGYDNDYIDFICLGDPRQSDIDIRQILGRGLRWNKDLYPNKLLHLLVPLYRDEFGNCTKNEHLKKYLDYIIGECGQDIIFKNNGNVVLSDEKHIDKKENNYDGENIPTEILREYCTTGYNKFTDFIKFLKSNKIYDEESYNKLKENQDWMVSLGYIQKKYPKFCFRNIHPNNINYYWNKKNALESYNSCVNKLIKQIGRNKYRKLNSRYKLNKINEIDKKIPIVNFDLYYPKD